MAARAAQRPVLPSPCRPAAIATFARTATGTGPKSRPRNAAESDRSPAPKDRQAAQSRRWVSSASDASGSSPPSMAVASELRAAA